MPKNEERSRVVFVTDRGGHLHDAMRLVLQMKIVPRAIIITPGPDVDYLKRTSELAGTEILTVPQAFSWLGKKRLWNPFRFSWLLAKSLFYVLRIRPSAVISTGASNVVPVCYFAKLVGAKVIHVENLAQVVNRSIAGRLLYPIADGFYVQWQDLLKQYGPKARYEGWVV